MITDVTVPQDSGASQDGLGRVSLSVMRRNFTLQFPTTPTTRCRKKYKGADNEKNKPYIVQYLRTLLAQLIQLQLSSSNEMTDQLLPGPIRRQGMFYFTLLSPLYISLAQEVDSTARHGQDCEVTLPGLLHHR